MKILFIAPWLPSVIRPRSLAILRELVIQHEVGFCGLTSSAERIDDLERLPIAFMRTVEQQWLSSMLRALAALPSGQSLQLAYVRDQRLSTLIQSVVEEWQPDLCYFNVIRSTAFLEDVGDRRVVIDLDEVRSDYYRQMSTSGKLATRLLGAIEAPRLEAAEKRAVERAESYFVSSPVDLAPVHGHEGRLLRSSFLVGQSASERTGHSGNVILFVGRLSYKPNADAVVWFAERVLPLVRQAIPDATLRIVGERPGAAIRRLACASIEVAGFVENLDEEYARAVVNIVPINVGTGVQMKLLQGLATGVPTVTTPEVARRAGLVAGEECLVASTESEWARAVGDLLQHPDLGSSLGASGAAWIEREYAPNVLFGELHRALAGGE